MERTSSHSSVEGAQSADQPPELVGDVWSQAGDKGDSGDTSVDGESLEVLSNLANTVQSVYETLQDGTLAEGYETGSVNRLRGDMAQAKGTLLKYGLHLTTVADRVNFLSDKLNVTSNLIKTKLQDEHIPFSDENGGETDEIWALEHAATAHSAFAQAAVDLAEMQKLASEIAESAYKATAAAERCKTRAEIVDERLDTAAGQTQKEQKKTKRRQVVMMKRRTNKKGVIMFDNSVSNGNAENEDEKPNEDSVNTEEQKEDAQENKPIPEVEAKQGETVDSEVTETNQAKNSEKEAKQNTTEDKSVKDSSDVARQTETIAQQQCDDKDVSTSGTDNTRDWPLITYPVAPEADSAEAGIACIVRAPEDALDKMQLQCDVIDSWDGTYKLANQEARVSNIVQLSSKGEPLHFDVSICVALPYRSPRGGMSREHTLVVMADQGNGEWAQLTSSETTFVDYKDIRFLEVRVNEIGSLTLLTVTKLKLDRHTITSRGGRITSSVDSRVCVVAPKRAFGAGAELSMQVCPVDSTVVAELKSRFAGCDSIIRYI
ncbi:hypothetical protein LSAT2_009848 [Lamellibrachia satsuma]|nr:hypothetical protein LSAT2_009848 [Lamellibrachia satsuma]